MNDLLFPSPALHGAEAQQQQRPSLGVERTGRFRRRGTQARTSGH